MDWSDFNFGLKSFPLQFISRFLTTWPSFIIPIEKRPVFFVRRYIYIFFFLQTLSSNLLYFHVPNGPSHLYKFNIEKEPFKDVRWHGLCNRRHQRGYNNNNNNNMSLKLCLINDVIENQIFFFYHRLYFFGKYIYFFFF